MSDPLDQIDERRLVAPQLRKIVGVLGLPLALKLLRERGGNTYRLPVGNDPMLFPEILGEDAARNLARLFQGKEYVWLNKADKIVLELRDREIRATAAELSSREQALKYDLTDRQVKNIRRGDRGDRYREVLEKQLKCSLQRDLFQAAK